MNRRHEEPLERVKRFLSHQSGLPLERDVARSFERVGWAVTQADFYKDPGDNKIKEIDVVARLSYEENEYRHIEVAVVAECKRSANPWLLLGRTQPLHPTLRVVNRIATKLGRSLLLDVQDAESWQEQKLFVGSGRDAYALVEVRNPTKEQESSYLAMLQSTAAAYALSLKSEAPEGSVRSQMFVPIIVTTAPLFYLNADDDLERVPWGSVMWRKPVAGIPYTIVEVVEAGKMDSFATYLTNAADEINAV